MTFYDHPIDDASREHMEVWFRMGESPEGLQECREYLYRTAASRLSPSGLMCVCQAARDALRIRDEEIAVLQRQLNEAHQLQIALTGGA